jgi:hypothetical protein
MRESRIEHQGAKTPRKTYELLPAALMNTPKACLPLDFLGVLAPWRFNTSA